MTHLVNAVGGGDLNQEVDLNELYIDIKGEEVRYAPEHWPGLSVKFTNDSPTVMIFRTGKYNIAGASSISELKSANKKIITQLQKLNVGGNVSDFEVRNLVYLHNYDRELDLNQLTIGLGMERTEYEPEQFGGVLYKRPNVNGTFMIFRNGKIILTGAKEPQEAKTDLESFCDKLDSLFD